MYCNKKIREGREKERQREKRRERKGDSARGRNVHRFTMYCRKKYSLLPL